MERLNQRNRHGSSRCFQAEIHGLHDLTTGVTQVLPQRLLCRKPTTIPPVNSAFPAVKMAFAVRLMRTVMTRAPRGA